jgi:hypothetical protein
VRSGAVVGIIGPGFLYLTQYYIIGNVYILTKTGEPMAKALTSLRLDDRLVRRAQKVLGAKSRTQTIEMSLEAVVETEKHRKLIKRYSGKARPGDFDHS